jgi:PBP1b-binding outer membrane lipoprotein LpoB
MRKILSLIAMASIIIGLTGCMDDPDGSKQSTRAAPAKDTKSY